ncbi:MAG TPA: hypothetical protein VKF36_16585 [Syntrophorhabdales bacterium]|nr:hypothetical protein [Syntrophorhabdales bacterium]
MKRIMLVFILSLILVGMSIPVLAEEHGRGGERGHGYAKGHERVYRGGNRGYYNQGHYYAAPVYAPPPVYYAPNPYPPPGISFVIPLNIH